MTPKEELALWNELSELRHRYRIARVLLMVCAAAVPIAVFTVYNLIETERHTAAAACWDENAAYWRRMSGER